MSCCTRKASSVALLPFPRRQRWNWSPWHVIQRPWWSPLPGQGIRWWQQVSPSRRAADRRGRHLACRRWGRGGRRRPHSSYLLLSFSVLAIVDQLIDFPLLSFTIRPDALEHATMYLHLAVYASVALATDGVASSHHGDAQAQLGDVVAALAASVFGQELFPSSPFLGALGTNERTCRPQERTAPARTPKGN
ncbi:Os02g0167775 [Oryza sativa Japonica Group]|uniref:Os02g0167775 protein n=1 Tax=Oryza sativa subsp. japonica TaxID=39947 RepID=A0A0P0VFD1_ORYSJ|nr:Os02g0167775 [Oryza sativa Japonica Group]